jgi:hypothetical protein
VWQVVLVKGEAKKGWALHMLEPSPEPTAVALTMALTLYRHPQPVPTPSHLTLTSALGSSLFDALEDMDVDACLAKCVELNAAQC